MNLSVLSVVLLVCMVGLSSALRYRGRLEDGPPEGPPPPEDGPDEHRVGHHGGHHGGHHLGPGGRKHGPPPSMLDMFSSCNAMAEAIKQKHEEMWKSKQIGPKAHNCQEQDRRECMRKDMNKVRCAVSVKPSDECVQDVMKYLQASACDAKEESGGSANQELTEGSTDQEWEAVKKQ